MSIVAEPTYAVIPKSDARSEPYGWGTLTFLADGKSGTSPEVSMARVTIQAGKRNILHRHPNCDELLYLLKGKLKHLVGDKWVTLEAGDTIRIARGLVHQAEVVSAEDADMIVVYSAGDRETEVLGEGSK
ncbi:MAG: cupin domain-containing protein [Planctomycetes bacterium]|nr:cupin domain-containing protein [Planctomycetota bacterium]